MRLKKAGLPFTHGMKVGNYTDKPKPPKSLFPEVPKITQEHEDLRKLLRWYYTNYPTL